MKFESINLTRLVKDLLTQKENESTKFNEEEFKANPVDRSKDILKEQASKQLGVKNNGTRRILLKRDGKRFQNHENNTNSWRSSQFHQNCSNY